MPTRSPQSISAILMMDYVEIESSRGLLINPSLANDPAVLDNSCELKPSSFGIAAYARASKRGSSDLARRATDHAVVASSGDVNSLRMRIASVEIALRRGSALTLRGANAHGVKASSGGPKFWMFAREAADIESRRGMFLKPSLAIAHAMLVMWCGSKWSIRACTSATMASKVGSLARLARPSALASRWKAVTRLRSMKAALRLSNKSKISAELRYAHISRLSPPSRGAPPVSAAPGGLLLLRATLAERRTLAPASPPSS